MKNKIPMGAIIAAIVAVLGIIIFAAVKYFGPEAPQVDMRSKYMNRDPTNQKRQGPAGQPGQGGAPQPAGGDARFSSAVRPAQ
jgi:hypothetical protein